MLYIMQDDTTTTIVSYDGCMSTIENYDGGFRVEHYDGTPFMDCNTTEDLQLVWEQSNLYHIGEYPTMSEALPMAVKHVLPRAIANKLIGLNLLLKDDTYWFIKFESVPDANQLSKVKEWMTEMKTTEWESYANESRRESEYYVTYEDNECQETLLIGIADIFDSVAIELRLNKS